MGVNEKRAAGVSSKQSYGSAARRIVQGALKDVLRWLPLAAEHTCADDGENVHRLRVATRRASVALRAFRDLTDRDESDALRDALRQIRHAADAARNIDATSERFLSHCVGVSEELRAKLRERLVVSRKEAQGAIITMHQRLSDGSFDERVRLVLCDMLNRYPKRAAKTFGKRARSILKPALKNFFHASKTDVTDDAGLHYLRIQAKKLRYTMEIVSVAFAPSFSGELYQKFCSFQDTMGAIRDCVIMEDMLRGWLESPCDAAEREFLAGLLKIETNSHAGWMLKFQSLWTKNFVRDLKREFAGHMKNG